MSQENLVLHSMSEVVAAVPHFLGVHPQDSLVVVPEVTGDAPVARVNLPHGAPQTAAVAEGLARAYAGAGVGVVLLAYTDAAGSGTRGVRHGPGAAGAGDPGDRCGGGRRRRLGAPGRTEPG